MSYLKLSKTKEIDMNGNFATIPKGSTLIICNPDWDGDKPNTHFYQRIELQEAVSVQIEDFISAQLCDEKLTQDQVNELLACMGF